MVVTVDIRSRPEKQGWLADVRSSTAPSEAKRKRRPEAVESCFAAHLLLFQCGKLKDRQIFDQGFYDAVRQAHKRMWLRRLLGFQDTASPADVNDRVELLFEWTEEGEDPVVTLSETWADVEVLLSHNDEAVSGLGLFESFAAYLLEENAKKRGEIWAVILAVREGRAEIAPKLSGGGSKAGSTPNAQLSSAVGAKLHSTVNPPLGVGAAVASSVEKESKPNLPVASLRSVFAVVLAELQKIIDTGDGGRFAAVAAEIFPPENPALKGGTVDIAALLERIRPDVALQAAHNWLFDNPETTVSWETLSKFSLGIAMVAVDCAWVAQNRARAPGTLTLVPSVTSVTLNEPVNLGYWLIKALTVSRLEHIEYDRLIPQGDPKALPALRFSDPREIRFGGVMSRDPTPRTRLDELKRVVVQAVDRNDPSSPKSPDELERRFRKCLKDMKGERGLKNPFWFLLPESELGEAVKSLLLEAGIADDMFERILREAPSLEHVIPEAIGVVKALDRIRERMKKKHAAGA